MYLFGSSVKLHHHHHQSELQITPWRGRHTIWKAYINLPACNLAVAVVGLSGWGLCRLLPPRPSVWMKDELLRRRRCPSRWCALVSSQTLVHPLVPARLPNFFVWARSADCLPRPCGCSLFRDRRISGHLQLQRGGEAGKMAIIH